MAEEVNAVSPLLASYSIREGGLELNGVKYERMSALFVKAIQELNLKVDGIEERVAALEASGGSGGGGTSLTAMASQFFDTVLTSVSDGVAYMRGLVTETLTVGSPTKRVGITLYDKTTGNPYCIEIENGVQQTTAGECVVTDASQTSSVVNNTGENQNTSFSDSSSPSPSTGEGDLTPNPPLSGEGQGEVGDVTPPIITLTGETTVNLNVGDTYNESGATVTDDTDASVAVIISGSVDTATAGSYSITYNATDTAGNQATEVTRTVVVAEEVTTTP